MKEIIGIDFDNTIVKYDELFHKVATERQLIPDSIEISKEAVRDYLRSIGKEDDWTEMQGYVYGARMEESIAFPGILEFIRDAIKRDYIVNIVSHKTQYPYKGFQYDLHSAAINWMEKNGLFDKFQIGLKRQNVYFELSKKDKIKRIGSLGCNAFIDDLPEILNDNEFPGNCRKILFGRSAGNSKESYARLFSWTDLNAVYQTLGYG